MLSVKVIGLEDDLEVTAEVTVCGSGKHGALTSSPAEWRTGMSSEVESIIQRQNLLPGVHVNVLSIHIQFFETFMLGCRVHKLIAQKTQ